MRLMRIITTVLLFFIPFLTNTFAEGYTQWALPEGAKFRFGKGKMSNYEGHITNIGKRRSYHFSPDSTQFSVMTSIGIWEYDVMTGKEIKLSRLNRIRLEYDVVVSPDSHKIAIKRNHRIEIWDLITNQLKNIFENIHDRSIFKDVNSVAFSPGGQTLASTDYSGIIRLWDIESGIYSEIQTPNDFVGSVMFSPDGRTLVSSRDENVQLWDIKTKKSKVTLEDTTDVNNIIFNSDGSALFGLGKNEIRFWDSETGKIRIRLELDGSYRPPFALSSDGKTLATARRNDYKVKLWDTQTGQLKNTLIGDARYIKMLAIANGKPQWVNYATRSVESIAFSPNGKILAVASDGDIALWNPETGHPMNILPVNETHYNLMFSPDGRTLASRSYVSLDGSQINLWSIDTTDIQNSGLRHIITGHYSEVSSLAFNLDGEILASGYHVAKIRFWDVEDGKLKKSGEGYPYQLNVQSLAFAPNQDILASLNINSQNSGGIAEILLWNATTGEYQKSLKVHDKGIGNTRPISHGGGVVFSFDGKKIMSGSLDGTIRLVNVEAKASKSLVGLFRNSPLGKQKPILRGHTDQIFSIALSPDGRTLASGSLDRTLRLWDTHTLKLKYTLNGHTEGIRTIAFTPDGLTLVSGCRDGSIHLWNPLTGKHKRSVIGNALFTQPPTLPRKKDDPPNITGQGRSAVSSLLFSHDGKTLVNGNSDGSIHFWDMSTLQISSTLSGQVGLNSLTISPDGSSLASGSSDGTVLIWDLNESNAE